MIPNFQIFGNHEVDENFQINREELKQSQTRSLLSEILGDSVSDLYMEEIPILHQTDPNFIKFEHFALWALKRANSTNIIG